MLRCARSSNTFFRQQNSLIQHALQSTDSVIHHISNPEAAYSSSPPLLQVGQHADRLQVADQPLAQKSPKTKKTHLEDAQRLIKLLEPSASRARRRTLSKRVAEALEIVLTDTNNRSSTPQLFTSKARNHRKIAPFNNTQQTKDEFLRSRLVINLARLEKTQKKASKQMDGHLDPLVGLLKAQRTYLLAQQAMSESFDGPRPNQQKKSSRRKISPSVSVTGERGQFRNGASHIDESYESAELEVYEYSRRLEGDLIASEGTTLEEVISLHNSPIAQLAHGLDRVLFNPAVYWLQDPHSNVYNFPPALQKVPSISDFDFERVTGFISSSQDKELSRLAEIHGKKFTGSTSSLSGILSHIYYLISGHKPPDISVLTPPFHKLRGGFSGGTTVAALVAFRKLSSVGDLYAVESLGDKSEEGKNVLTFLGTMLEKYLTLSHTSFAQLLKATQLSEPLPVMPEAYRYSKSSSFLMRSQLDCKDARLPGSGVFDIKTRACVAIRLDQLNWEANAGYQIIKQTGVYESFEREYFDLIRSAFLKYQFQARIGNMDGVFVAYHNTKKLFGFQYIPLSEMDARLFGSSSVGERVFQMCVKLMEVLAEEVITCYPNESIECLFETLKDDKCMNIWVQPTKQLSAPADPPESASRGSISLITVTASSFVNKAPVKQEVGVASDSNLWKIHYTITHSAQSQEEIWQSHLAAISRRNFAMYLPSGFSAEDFIEKWQSLNYGAPDFTTHDQQRSTALTTKKFIAPHKTIKKLRNIARRGNGIVGDEGPQKQVVWGMPIDDVIENAFASDESIDNNQK